MPYQVTRKVNTKDGSDYQVNDKLMMFTSYAGSPQAAVEDASRVLGVPSHMLEATFYQDGARIAEGPDGTILSPPTLAEVGRWLGLGRDATQQEYDEVMSGSQAVDLGGPEARPSSGRWW